MPQPFLSVVIPAWNESLNIGSGKLDQVYKYLSAQDFSWEIVLVDDGSTDDTGPLLHAFSKKHKSSVRVIDNPHQGKAASIITGVLASRGEIVLFSDTDQATPISELAKFLPKFREGYQLVIGSRSGRQGAPLFRQILAYGMVILRTLILRLPFKDTQCGFKAFTSRSAKAIFTILRSVHPSQVIVGGAVNPGFDVEILYLGRKLGYQIAEVPVQWRYQKTERVGFFKDAVAGLWELLLVRFRSLTNAYRLK